jgi:histidyl-tRNA synthetase
MLMEHEIPEGSKLYFGEIARTKRKIENLASEIFEKNQFQEIVLPSFSYHQLKSLASEQLIHLTDRNNYPMNLRADSTIDLSKILLKRVGKSNQNSRWFYIQPIYRYPSSEQYQIGAEKIGNTDLNEILKINIDIFSALNFFPLLQLSNIAIPKLISEKLNISIKLFQNIEIKKLLELKIDWLTKLIYLEKVEEIQDILEDLPDFLKDEVLAIQELAQNIKYKDVRVAPLYYTKMDYYDNLIFKFIGDNRVFARGGRYSIDEISSVGFSIYTDEVLSFI